jgi:glycosyltransferase involved in cell wall biosynthesis
MLHIAIFDYITTRANPAGSCQRAIIEQLGRDHQITLFSVEYDSVPGVSVRWVKVPCPRRPLFVLFWTFHALAALIYFIHRVRYRRSFDVIQFVESNFAFGDLCYSHFCHTTYLKRYFSWRGASKLRAVARWLDHWSHSILERRTYRRAKLIVVPSRGLAMEIQRTFEIADKSIRVVSNPLKCKGDPVLSYDEKVRIRRTLSLPSEGRLLAFVALGHFERKGLPELIMALDGIVSDSSIRLVVVGGDPSSFIPYARLAARLGLGERVVFRSTESNLTPYYQAVDALCLPSRYEVLPLVAIEATAFGLPILCTPVNGLAEIVVDGFNGFRIPECDPTAIRCAIRRWLSLDKNSLAQMSLAALESSRAFSPESFGDRWRAVYRDLDPPSVDAFSSSSGNFQTEN